MFALVRLERCGQRRMLNDIDKLAGLFLTDRNTSALDLLAIHLSHSART